MLRQIMFIYQKQPFRSSASYRNNFRCLTVCYEVTKSRMRFLANNTRLKICTAFMCFSCYLISVWWCLMLSEVSMSMSMCRQLSVSMCSETYSQENIEQLFIYPLVNSALSTLSDDSGRCCQCCKCNNQRRTAMSELFLCFL